MRYVSLNGLMTQLITKKYPLLVRAIFVKPNCHDCSNEIRTYCDHFLFRQMLPNKCHIKLVFTSFQKTPNFRADGKMSEK